MPTGNVKWFDTKKGYGFIIGETGQDVFVHYTSIVGDGFRSLKDGEAVDYELVQSDKGFQARNVCRKVAAAVASVGPDGGSRPGPGAGADGHATLAPPPAGEGLAGGQGAVAS